MAVHVLCNALQLICLFEHHTETKCWTSFEVWGVTGS